MYKSIFSTITVTVMAVFMLSRPALAQSGPGQRLSPDGTWMFLDAQAPTVQNATPWIRPVRGQALVLKIASMRAALAAAPLESDMLAGVPPLVVALPDPNGGLQHFAMAESPVMEPGLAMQFPDIHTYVGQGIDDPSATLRADVTPQGFHAQVLTPAGRWYIDPYNAGDDAHYTSYYLRDLKNTHAWQCLGAERDALQAEPPTNYSGVLTSGPTLRTYRVAVACTGEYAAFHGGTVALAQAAIVSAINRVTGVYETELAVRLTLIANNSSVVYTDANSDPFTNSNGSTMLTQNQNNMTSVIGSANYDIGHVFSTGGGGIAGLGVVCTSGSKARGVTGSSSPTGDGFWIDYVAHEMGHQFGGNHAFDGVNGSCTGGNRNDSTAYEPGSGTTIMNYAGICGADDIQPHSDPYFNWISLQEIRAYVTTGGGAACGTSTSTGNSAPTITAPGIGGLTIPKGTPFTLTAVGSDPNGDALTFCWEEHNLGAGSSGVALSAADNGSMPLTRSFNPTTSPSRTVPQLSKILAGTSDNFEKLPALARASYSWTVTARDNRAGGGGVERADVSFAVNATAGPFTVTAPASAVSWAAGTTQTVTWNVAGTTANGINTANVSILLSTDGGNTFPITLVASTPNSGSASFVVPNNQTATGRIKVQPVGNIYFNIAPGTVTITPPVNGPILSGNGANTLTDTTGNGNANGRADPGETAINLTVGVGNTGNQTATSVSGTLTSLTGTATVTTATSAYANINAGSSANNSTPYIISLSPSHPCGTPVSLRLSITSAQTTGTYDFAIPTGVSGAPVTQTFTYAGAAVAIPDNSATGANATITVSGLSGAITDVNFRFDGSSCSTATGSTTVGLDHTYVGDLIITLTSPQGTPVTLANRPGAGGVPGSSGNNFCQTVFDDASATSIQAVANAGTEAPYTGTFSPASSLSAFNGQAANGTWTLNVADLASVDTGNIRAFSIIITTTSTVCDPPASGSTCPSITTNPTTQTICSGGSVTFSAAATGSPAPTYQWRKNTNPIGGATSASLTINPVGAGDVGSYDCVATNSCGTATTSAATLTVNSAPGVTSSPGSLTRCPTTSATFTASFSGSPAPTLQWRKNTNPIGGATSASLTINPVSAGDTGSYDCVATNSCGTATSSAAVLTVSSGPGFSGSPSPSTVCAGQPASFSVTVTGTPTPTLQWRKNTNPIGGATSATYSIPAVAAGDAGSYDCVATNSCGNVTSAAAALTVNAAPSISSQPAAATVCEGQPASFTVAASGTPAPTFQWRKNTNPIGGATSATYSVPTAATSDSGSYDCVITNTCGSLTSTAVALTVNTGPAFGVPPSPSTVCAGQPASFSVTVTGTPTPTLQWRKDTNPIGGATSATYSIPAAAAGDAGSYDCVATNTCGNVTSAAAALTVHTAPSVSTQPAPATTCEGQPASFTVAASGTPAPTFQWRKNTNPIGGATSATYSIPAAAAGDVGSYDCVITNTCGSVTCDSASLTVSTQPAITGQPANVGVCEGSPASFTAGASGTPAPSYQWRKGTNPISGATSPTYSIPAAGATDAGSYDCVITNTCGSSTTSAATLTVTAGPGITTQPLPQSTCRGGSATLTIAASGTPAPSYQWRKNTVDIPTATGPSLTITPAQPGDAGSYDCVVTADCGLVTSIAVSLTITCPTLADIAGVGNVPGCDGQVTVDDLVYFLGRFFDSDIAVADVAGIGNTPNPDGQVTVDDLVVFLNAFFAACP